MSRRQKQQAEDEYIFWWGADVEDTTPCMCGCPKSYHAFNSDECLCGKCQKFRRAE